ncbi:hypothetical protein DL546_008333 [Coniochaeta pulveracea]|uniref:Uncharacterized protein n=1 Tax=Coniochaeta pulveracea TaxID=177199 RepID=A0A420YIB6_9PEZI|nr:hypothetical protein DL546_008333 [Coniochaeta pulveracea]
MVTTQPAGVIRHWSFLIEFLQGSFSNIKAPFSQGTEAPPEEEGLAISTTLFASGALVSRLIQNLSARPHLVQTSRRSLPGLSGSTGTSVALPKTNHHVNRYTTTGSHACDAFLYQHIS